MVCTVHSMHGYVIFSYDMMVALYLAMSFGPSVVLSFKQCKMVYLYLVCTMHRMHGYFMHYDD
jgi:hypothetical protein